MCSKYVNQFWSSTNKTYICMRMKIPIEIDIMEIMKHTYIENIVWVYTKWISIEIPIENNNVNQVYNS